MNSIVNESTTQRQGGEGGPTNPASPSDVVAALRRHEWVRIMQEAADLIEQQAERIKELEAERDGWREDANISRNSIAMLKDRCNHFEDTLAALRQRIADAPVVAWMGEYNINDIRDHYTVVMRHKTDFSSMPDRVRPLYTHPQPAIPEGWQPIETAPKDGSDFLAYNPMTRKHVVVFWKHDAWIFPELVFSSSITHWMPLPAAPKPENSHE